VHYVENLNIRKLFEKIAEREYLERQLKELKDIDILNMKKIREVYNKVIPEISSSTKVMNPSIKCHIDKLEILWMKECMSG
jgi:hypothetical protein